MLIIQSSSHSPSFNLAAEEYLFTQRQDEILFLYTNNASVIIGSNQVIRNEVNLDFCSKNNISVMRRMSGGGAVFHDLGNLNFCFISNKSAPNASLNTEFLQPIIQVLTDLGLPVSIGKRKDIWLENVSKITGTASHITKTRALHHGTLLYDSDIDKLNKALDSNTKDEKVRGIASVRSSVKNVKAYFEEQGQFTLNAIDFFDVFIRQLAVYFHQENCVMLSETEEIQELAHKKYMSEEWTYKK